MEGSLAKLAAHASRHHGLFRGCDALEHGVSRQQIRTLVAKGWCERLAPGVFRVVGAPSTGEQVILAQVWAHRTDRAVAGYRSAAYLWRLVGYPRARPEVLHPRGVSQRGGRRSHGSLWLPAAHVTIRDRIPTTTVARTLFDLAGLEPLGRVEVALDDALSRRLCTLRQLNQVFFALASRGRRGTVAMRRLLDDRGEGYVPPASALERRARRVFAAAGLPTPAFELHLGVDEVIGRVDCVWREARLVVELDSRRFHGSRSAREADRLRDNELMAAGWRVIRVTWEDLGARPEAVVAQIRAAIAASR